MQPNDDKWKLAAKEGREAITVLQPDLIVTDFKMPLADGIQAATEISATTPSSIVMYAIYISDELMHKQASCVCCLETGRPSQFASRH